MKFVRVAGESGLREAASYGVTARSCRRRSRTDYIMSRRHVAPGPNLRCIPESPGRRRCVAPALSHELRREAPVDAVDPVTAMSTGCCSYPRREGKRRIPANPAPSTKFQPMVPLSLLPFFQFEPRRATWRSLGHASPRMFLHRLDNALHRHHPRSFDQDDVARQDRVAEMRQGGLGALARDGVGRLQSRSPCAADHVRGKLPARISISA
jgi:hypothetical protein